MQDDLSRILELMNRGHIELKAIGVELERKKETERCEQISTKELIRMIDDNTNLSETQRWEWEELQRRLKFKEVIKNGRD